MLVTGGSEGDDDLYLRSAELYDSEADGGKGVWAMAGPLEVGRARHKAMLLPSGTVLIVAGNDGGDRGGWIGGIELYDPATNMGKGTSLVIGQTYLGLQPTAILLPDGDVLIVGTETYERNCSHNAVVLSTDQKTVEVAAANDLINLCEPTATLLPNGSVLLVGVSAHGFFESYEEVVSALLFDPTKWPGDLEGAWMKMDLPQAARNKYHSATLLPNGTVLIAGSKWGRVL